MKDIIKRFENKKVLIWGYGMEGKAAESFLGKYCRCASVEIYEGDRTKLPEADFDFIIKSPGVPYIYTDEPKFTSLTELFLEAFGENTIGITGTKGKSTTTSMIYKALSESLDSEVCLLGNIGIPCMDAYEQMKNGAIAVFEMSCHQLANNQVSPHIAVFLNLYEDHLDYYKTREKYFDAKAHITRFQNENDYYYHGEDVPVISTKAKCVTVPSFDENKYDLKIPGQHNQWNAHVAYRIATELFGADQTKVKKALEGFEGLPHRLEKFDVINGVTYFDDSISTIPEATINAILSVPDVKTVIVGGMDRGIDYTPLEEKIKEREDITFILCYASGKRILEELDEKTRNVIYKDDLASAAKEAKKITAAGSVIMSPAAASYGYFKNFMERGKFFKECIRL